MEISSNLSELNIDDATELEQFDMMIQSAGPFQHPRSSQAYGHGTNTFRQSYHHQVRNLYTNIHTNRKIRFAYTQSTISAIFSFCYLWYVEFTILPSPAIPEPILCVDTIFSFLKQINAPVKGASGFSLETALHLMVTKNWQQHNFFFYVYLRPLPIIRKHSMFMVTIGLTT